jgi:hypothetical protein
MGRTPKICDVLISKSVALFDHIDEVRVDSSEKYLKFREAEKCKLSTNAGLESHL